ncbi:MAG: alpha/beta fold hydrolase [Anaerolineales bacterium]|nr:alpha/beta fold hydrolase [Anaerolineales bacterium]
MSRKNVLIITICTALFMLACNFGGLLTPKPTEAPATEPASVTDTPAPTETNNMTSMLERLGGETCEENTDFTCVTIQVPLNHFDTANTETLDVVFAVAPATGERYGMYVQAFPGGPGGEGISSGGLYWIPETILEHFDIVYFDQRGLGLSGPLTCPTAYAKDFLGYLNETNKAGLEGYDTPAEQQSAIDDARTFVESCVAEIGIDPVKLNYYGTDQVAEDIESFRKEVGDEKFWLYGVSYGTAVAQTYAASHADRLAGLVLDGTIDMTLTGEEGALAQEKAFDKVLVAVLKACDADEACAAELGGDALAVYDKLAAQISKKPMAYEFPLPDGTKVKRTFTFNQWEYTTAYQMYSLGGRMLFLRALASANQGDIIPMARLLYQQANLDPATGDYIGDPTFSDTMFYDVNCTDDSYFSGTPEEKIAKTIEAGQASNGTVPRVDGSVYTGLYCAFWPSAPKEVVKNEPLIADGVPTIVLNATLDPATPFEEGKVVAERLADGYHIYVDGGLHSIFGYGNECPDDYITNFLVKGELPAERETVCKWDPSVVRAYKPLIAKDVSDFADPLEVFLAIDSNLLSQPEFYYSDFSEDVSFACNYGGSFTFGPSETGEAYSYENCAFTKGFAITGKGGYDSNSGVLTLEAEISGKKKGTLTYTKNYDDGTSSVTGEYGGETIDLSQ